MIICPVDVGIDTIQKSQDRDGNESDNSYCTSEETIPYWKRKIGWMLTWHDLTDRDEIEDFDSGGISVASNRAPSPIEPHRETTNERVSSVVNISIPQPQNESGFNFDRGQDSVIQYQGVKRSHSSNQNPRQQVSNQSSQNFPSQFLQGSS